MISVQIIITEWENRYYHFLEANDYNDFDEEYIMQAKAYGYFSLNPIELSFVPVVGMTIELDTFCDKYDNPALLKNFITDHGPVTKISRVSIINAGLRIYLDEFF